MPADPLFHQPANRYWLNSVERFQQEPNKLLWPLKFVKDNFLSSYDFSFKFSKTGIEYKNETIRVWVEDVENIGITLELEAEDINILNDFISHFNVKEKLDISLPEYYYLKYVKA